MQLSKLATTKVLERKRKRDQVIVGVVLVTIMILSIAGYAMNSGGGESLEYTYNGFEFSRSEQGWWQVMKQPFNLATRFLPQEVENISLQGSWSINDFSGKEAYLVAYSGEAKIAGGEIVRNLPFKRVQYVCFEDDANLSLCADLPLKTCDNNVIFINSLSRSRAGNETEDRGEVEPRVLRDGNCMVIEAEYNDLVKAADRFLFDVYGVM